MCSAKCRSGRRECRNVIDDDMVVARSLTKSFGEFVAPIMPAQIATGELAWAPLRGTCSLAAMGGAGPWLASVAPRGAAADLRPRVRLGDRRGYWPA